MGFIQQNGFKMSLSDDGLYSEKCIQNVFLGLSVLN